MKLKSMTLALVAAGILAAGSASALSWHPSNWFAKSTPASDAAPVIPPALARPSPGNAALRSTEQNQAGPAATGAPIAQIAAPNYRAIVAQYAPAVVGITTDGVVQTASQDGGDGAPDDPFFQFFRNFPGQQGMMPQRRMPMHGVGSGFIVRSDGLILTNAHVVRGADEVTVKLSDRSEYKAKVLGSDPVTDVAVLKIDAKNLPTVKLGSAADLAVGDYVLAIGSPFGFEHSATSGIVSAKGRSLPGDSYVPFIQTDVAVNPGNSGGPLFAANGEVIGINSQIYSQTGGYQGVSFAIPIDVALRVEDQVVATGKVSHARLGVAVQELTQALAESFKLKEPNGALVSSVVPGSAAAKAGIEPGDVILKYNAQPIESSSDLPALVGIAKPGDRVTLEVWRAGKKVGLSAVMSADPTVVAATDEAGDNNARQGRLGVAVRPLTDEEQHEANLSSGVVVEQTSGAAARAGIRPGDVIVSVNGAPVKSVEQLRGVVAGSPKQMALLVQRGGDRIFIPVKIG